MKYYKCLNNKQYYSFTEGKIYNENSLGDNDDLPFSLKGFQPSIYWQEVTEKEYWQQELDAGKLIDGAYYKMPKYGIGTILKYNSKEAMYYIGGGTLEFLRNGEFSRPEDCILATDDEIEWLESCNKADKFITKEEFMKSKEFVLPEKWCIRGSEELGEYQTTILENKSNCRLSYSNYYYYNVGSSINLEEAKASSILPEGYTEITFEQFKQYVLGIKENKVFVKVINNGREFTTHPKAKEYGMTNYMFWKKLPGLKEGGIYEVVKEVLVNYDDMSYILKDTEGIEYLISKEGCEIVNQKEEMNKKVIGYKLIKPEYKEAVNKICKTTDFDFDAFAEIGKSSFTLATRDLERAGVLNLWFEEVYEPEYKVGDWVVVEKPCSTSSNKKGKVDKISDIFDGSLSEFGSCIIYKIGSGSYEHISGIRKATESEIEVATKPKIIIKGYEAQFTDDSVKFGCQEYDKDFVLQLGKFLDNSGLKLEDSDNVMNVVNHFRNLEDGDIYPVDYGYEKDNYDDFGL